MGCQRQQIQSWLRSWRKINRSQQKRSQTRKQILRCPWSQSWINRKNQRSKPITPWRKKNLKIIQIKTNPQRHFLQSKQSHHQHDQKNPPLRNLRIPHQTLNLQINLQKRTRKSKQIKNPPPIQRRNRKRIRTIRYHLYWRPHPRNRHLWNPLQISQQLLMVSNTMYTLAVKWRS